MFSDCQRCTNIRHLRYYVPTDAGRSSTGERDFVFIWYDMIPGNSPDFKETMTDSDGKVHKTTVSRGKMRPEVWKRLLERDATTGNPAFVELAEQITEPFVSAIHDFQGSKAVFFDGKVLLLGDAFSLCRPHGGGSTSQAAVQVQQLVRCLEGDMSLSEWEEHGIKSSVDGAQFSLRMAHFFWYVNKQ